MSSAPIAESLRSFSVGPVPLGKIFLNRTRWSHDGQTKESKEQLSHTLQTSGAVILDNHTSRLDILGTGCALAHIPNLEHITAPVAAYLYFLPMLNASFFEKLNLQTPIEVLPVFRREKRRDQIASEYTRYDQGHLEHTMNTQYRDRARSVSQTPGQAVILAPFGTRKREEGKLIRHGVAELLHSSCPVFCSLTVFDWTSLRFVVSLSHNLPKFSRKTEREFMTQAILQSFREQKKALR